MLTLKYVILGFIQGMTEFLPVSSCAHLVILQKILSITQNQISLSIVLHLGTVLALVFFFFKQIIKTLKDRELMLLILLATLITGIIGILGKDFFTGFFNGSWWVCIFLLINGIILIFSKKFLLGKRDILDIKDAVLFGFFQGISIIPGISRSGITIFILLLRGVKWQTGFEFSFLSAIPAILGATFLEARKISFSLQIESKNFLLGFLVSFLSGILALWILKRILQKTKFHYFGYYCIIIAIISLLFMR
ncbi:MAG: undecaprenyl-diphosphate phosphatase [Candidatus Omnitrophica bacterium]|nr:undecaprenyl-diphosphate phosphatase [Candidatus Omnitrophota bacterium]